MKGLRANTSRFRKAATNNHQALGVSTTLGEAPEQKRKSSKQSPDPKLAFYSECGVRGVSFVFWYTTQTQSCFRSLSSLKAFFFSFFSIYLFFCLFLLFFKNTHLLVLPVPGHPFYFSFLFVCNFFLVQIM